MDFKPFYIKGNKVMPKNILNAFLGLLKTLETVIPSLILLLTK